MFQITNHDQKEVVLRLQKSKRVFIIGPFFNLSYNLQYIDTTKNLLFINCYNVNLGFIIFAKLLLAAVIKICKG